MMTLNTREREDGRMDQEGFPWPTDAWRCPMCNTRSYCHVHESKSDGVYGPGPMIRCLHCKDTFLPPEAKFRVHKSNAGPTLMFANCVVRSWVGCAHDDDAEELAYTLNQAASALTFDLPHATRRVCEAAQWVSDAFTAAPPEVGSISPRARSSLSVLRDRLSRA